MSSYSDVKIKTPKINGLNAYTHSTLTSQHIVHTNYFNKLSNSKTELNKKLSKLETKKSKETCPFKVYKINEEIDTLREQLNDAMNGSSESDYHLNIDDTIRGYYKSEDSSRNDYYANYLKKVDSTFSNKAINKKANNICPHCNIEMIVNHFDGQIICEKCGQTEFTIIQDNKQSYSDGIVTQDANYFAYKKITHFKECMDQIQGKQRTEIPQIVFKKLRKKMKAERIKDPANELTPIMVRNMLKELKYEKYYEHIIYIMAKFGYKPVIIPTDVEKKLEKMFTQVNIAFNVCCPADRKNFPSYKYVISKCIQIIGGYDWLLPLFPHPESQSRLDDMEELWRNVCKIVDLKFIPSK